MNTKIMALTLLAFVLVVAVSGCTTAPAGTDTTGGTEQQVTAAQENEAVSSLDSELLSENDEVEIGEMIRSSPFSFFFIICLRPPSYTSRTAWRRRPL